ncbi:MAG: hypothetical protein R2911_42265 [Caldilineaceae bacterium]
MKSGYCSNEIAHQQALVAGQKLVDSYEALGEYDQAYGYANDC